MNRIELPQTGEWRRVSPKLIAVELVSGAVFLLAISAVGIGMWYLGIGWLAIGLWAVALVTLINLALTPRRVRAIGYQLRDDDLLFRRGIMWQRFVAVPYGRMQLVDINRGPIARSLGLSELKFVTAAAAAGVTIPGLPEAEADELRDHLVLLAESRRAGL
ncbi:PH domain-containing protein [Lacisediminihabitans sp.]|uniref:PH domain-containing protein n=1 Tax=Lacisediminihabitans sp. TaxID=2787631 RepID=UPI002F94A099